MKALVGILSILLLVFVIRFLFGAEMVMAFGGIFTILLIVFVILFFLRTFKTSKRQMNRKITYVVFSAYVVILLVATITVGVMDKASSTESPRQLSSAKADQDSELFNKIRNKEFSSIDPSLILESRTHQTGETLRLTRATHDRFDELPFIYIERKSENDGMIEETVYKPLLIINDLDFSDRLRYALPDWHQDEVIFRSPPATEIVFTSYRDAYLLSQFTQNRHENRNSFGSISRQIIIHLLVPASTEIEADDSLMITYLEE